MSDKPDGKLDSIQSLGRLVNDLRADLRETSSSIDRLEAALQSLHASAARLPQCCGETVDQIKKELESTADTATMIQRELTHLEDRLGDSIEDPTISMRSAAGILQLSLRVASDAFPATQLQALIDESESGLDVCRKLWLQWFEELTAYLSALLPYAGEVLEFHQTGRLGQSYEEGFQRLLARAEELERTLHKLHSTTYGKEGTPDEG